MAKKEKRLTGWISGTEKPVRNGVYQRLLDNNKLIFSRWSGNHWKFSGVSIKEAERATWESVFQYAPWRGLARRPR